MERTISPSLRSGRFFFSLAVLLLCTSQQGFSATTKDHIDSGNGEDLAPSGKGWGEQPDAKSQELANFPGKGAPASKGPARTKSTGISYHGGPLITSTATHIYYIWYGDWTNNNSAQNILKDFANNIGGSSYFNINTTYYDNLGIKVQNLPNAAFPNLRSPVLYSQAQATDNTGGYYPLGKSLTDSNIQQIVSTAISSGSIGNADLNAVYFVLTSADVNESSGFCTKYCGWHTHGTIAGMDIKYSFVGNPDRCPSACEWQTTSPNGNPGADGMASIIAHELEEAVTDPDLNAWYDTLGRENADKCAWTFGTTSTAPNGSLYNVTLGNSNYLIQQNWVNALSGYCKMSYP